jgi:hypothetical protein
MAARGDFMKTLLPNTGQIDPILYPILFPEDTTNGIDGDDWSAISLEVAVQRLLNRLEQNSVDLVARVADIATLTTALNNLTILNSDDDPNIASAYASIAAHTSALVGAHQATAIAVQAISGVTGTDAQAVLANLRGQIGARETAAAGHEARISNLETATGRKFVSMQSVAIGGFIREDIDTVFNVPGHNATITIGKTGSGANQIWSALDAIPTAAVAVRVRVFSDWDGSNLGQHVFYIFPNTIDITAYSVDVAANHAVWRAKYGLVQYGTQNGVIDVDVDTTMVFRLRWNTPGANNVTYQEKIYYGLYLDGYYL